MAGVVQGAFETHRPEGRVKDIKGGPSSKEIMGMVDPSRVWRDDERVLIVFYVECTFGFEGMTRLDGSLELERQI